MAGAPPNGQAGVQMRADERRRQTELERLQRGRAATVLSGPSASAVGMPLIVGN